jgi:hypothetical protein
MKVMKEWGSHLPVLIKLVGMTTGDILELGAGLYSTPFLHWACLPTKRHLVSYDSNIKYFNLTNQYKDTFHEVELVTNWDDIKIDRPWEIAFIDHVSERRGIETGRLANLANYVVIHDSDPVRHNAVYKYDEIYRLFKYRFDYKEVVPNTTILSNFVDLTDFKI